ncbi:GNAT family N-acetyltransferase [Oceanobacillus kimchii]|uniref:Ribosomal-protein-serine acetyltransferase n=1 Tax=Oceanobacillus kimchii TaxID=746691 RepID=A0ABQ5TJ46_9BACI|nr:MULTISPECIES: GNAT family protein [Oceanobacillus]MCT1578671.1 GNAT family N-acetyltransferase [Oceanobacillus kimchii]MCT2136280.1 GNAT family N-acetyltransferase [Oceanobacillus kimchii]OEH54309.1 ribosomal-protein-serine acetyltransferase [Oceanobacillus sp. E9]GLO65614.1 ribosomal-protein-serine acetyltransferase [Oceanobacillus kimchii]
MFYLKISKNICLSIFERKHATDLYLLIDRNREHLSKWLSFPVYTNKIEDTIAFIDKSQKRYIDNNGFWAGIWYKQQLVGAIGYLYIDWKAKKTEIGYWLGEEFQGKGCITIATQQLLNYAFKTLKLNKVEINVAKKNLKSLQIPKRLGFVEEGIIRDYEYLQGRYHDRIVHGLLRTEWVNQK